MTTTADAIEGETATWPSSPDDFLTALAAAVMGADKTAWSDLAEFTTDANNVVPIAPDASAEEIDTVIDKAIAKAKGLCLLVIPGPARNADPDAPGPRAIAEFELQLFCHPDLRPSDAPRPLAVVVSLMRLLHESKLEVAGYQWYEVLRWKDHEPLPDPDFTAYRIGFEREMQF